MRHYTCDALPPELAGRVAKLLGMLGSTFDNEALSAARLADRAVRAAGLTWFDALEPAPRAPELRRSEPSPVSWHATVSACIEADRRHGGLTDWEREFLDGLRRFPRLSPKQEAVLERVHRKLRERGAWS